VGPAVTVQWPWALLALLAVPFVVAWYRRKEQARARRRAELATLGMVAPAPAPGRRRWLPPALLLAALVLLLAGLARPEATVPEPRREGTVILVVDTSASMAAGDVAPTRLAAARATAIDFVARQPSTVLVGVVAFSGSGLVTQEPTGDRAVVSAAIDRLTPTGGTGVAQGLQTAIGAVVGRPVQVDAQGGVEPQGPDLGYHGSAAVVLLSDGENTGALDPSEVTDIASSAGIRVYPIGFGSPQGTVVGIDGFQVATALDEPLLRDIAQRTGGRYFAAADPQAPAAVFDAIDLAWTVRPRHIELTALVAALAGLLLLASAGISLRWTGRAV
jgi:Ca-activated chloride channel homolog